MLRVKLCKKCRMELPLEEFYKHSRMSDGHLNFCKTCVRNRVESHRLLNLESIQAYDRDRGRAPNRIASAIMNTKKFRERTLGASTQVNNAIRDGKLIRYPCKICGKDKSEAHHEDYSKPLAVTWLCRSHHMERHREINRARREAHERKF